MKPEELNRELEQSGRRLRTWNVQLATMRWGAIAIAVLFAFGMMDFFITFSRSGPRSYLAAACRADRVCLPTRFAQMACADDRRIGCCRH